MAENWGPTIGILSAVLAVLFLSVVGPRLCRRRHEAEDVVVVVVEKAEEVVEVPEDVEVVVHSHGQPVEFPHLWEPSAAPFWETPAYYLLSAPPAGTTLAASPRRFNAAEGLAEIATNLMRLVASFTRELNRRR